MEIKKDQLYWKIIVTIYITVKVLLIKYISLPSLISLKSIAALLLIKSEKLLFKIFNLPKYKKIKINKIYKILYIFIYNT